MESLDKASELSPRKDVTGRHSTPSAFYNAYTSLWVCTPGMQWFLRDNYFNTLVREVPYIFKDREPQCVRN